MTDVLVHRRPGRPRSPTLAERQQQLLEAQEQEIKKGGKDISDILASNNLRELKKLWHRMRSNTVYIIENTEKEPGCPITLGSGR